MQSKYKSVKPEMAQGMYGYLNLSQEQSVYAARFLETTRVRSLKSSLSFWERFDYELSYFSDFLSSEQMEKYHEWRNNSIENYKNDLIEYDNSVSTLKDIEWAEKEIDYLESEFLPALNKSHFRAHFRSDPHRTKFEFVKSEYKSFLDENQMATITWHIRNNRRYQPNSLKAELLKHKINAIYPNFRSFRAQMDDVIKIAVEFLSRELTRFPRGKDKLTPIVSALWAFQNKIADENFEYSKKTNRFYAFSNIEDSRTYDEKEQDFWFPLLLMDDEYYGYK